MKKYLLITSDKYKFEITEQEKSAIIKAINRGDKLLEIQDSVISLAITPTIIEHARWFAQEEQRLATMNKRLCKKCQSIMDASGGCPCWDREGGRDRNPIMLPDSVKAQLVKLAEAKSFPKLDYTEQPTPNFPRHIEVQEPSGPNYTLDEDGIKLYS